MAEQLYAVIDVETTGGTPYNSRITDISIFLTDGTKIIDEFSSLVNPQMPIPLFITELTGIDNKMVAGAPTFDEIAQRILDITEGATFVAHNVNFDYGMVQGEFRRLQYQFERKKLCTVRLSRQFIPGYRSYGLGKICGELGIPINGRHRARGDAEATTVLFHRIFNMAEGNLSYSDLKWIKALPPELTQEAIDRLPESAGVFYFYNKNGKVLMIGSSANLFKKVTSMITSKSAKNQDILAQTVDIDFEETGSELIASLKLSTEIVKHRPIYNRFPKASKYWEVTPSLDLFGYVKLDLMPIEKPSLSPSFKSRNEGLKFVTKLRKKYRLCAQLCSLDQSVCEDGLTQCPGACKYQEPAEAYNLRVKQAISTVQSQQDVVVLDRISSEEHAFVMIENHEYIGYGKLTSQDEAIQQLSDFRNYLIPDDPSFEKLSLIRSFIQKKNPKILHQ